MLSASIGILATCLYGITSDVMIGVFEAYDVAVVLAYFAGAESVVTDVADVVDDIVLIFY